MEKKSEVVTEKKATKTVTPAAEIWNDIKDKPIDMFALPNQLVNMYCKPVDIEPSKCYLKINASSVLPALELAVGPKYSVERSTHFVIVSYKVAE